jgi:glycine cleavage system H protein
MNNPDELLYAETHEWVRLSEEGGRKIGTIGITAFAIEQLTDLVHMVLPKVGGTVKLGQEFGEVESVKAVSSLYSPIDGEVIAVNSDLPNKLETLGSDPYGAGWLIKVAISDEAGLSKLMDKAAYERQCAAEG